MKLALLAEVHAKLEALGGRLAHARRFTERNRQRAYRSSNSARSGAFRRKRSSVSSAWPGT